MSVYAAVEGWITFPSREKLDKAMELLQKGGWIKDGQFVDEGDCEMSPDEAVEELTLVIPFGLYKNLAYTLNEITNKTTCRVVWTSTDGGFDGGVIIDGEETIYDLAVWAEQYTDYVKPSDEDDFDALCAWMTDVEESFHACN